MDEKLKFGIIGCGSIAQIVHIPILNRLNSVEIKAICDIDKKKVQQIANSYDIKNYYTDVEKFLSENEFDAVMILTPTNTHKEITELASNYCQNIFVEKPLARNSQEAKELCTSLKKKNTNIMVGMNMRFRPDAMLLKSVVDSGVLGFPYFVRVGWFRPRSSMQSWFVKKNISGGGAVLDLGLNILDLAMWLFDYPQIYSVTATNFYHTTKDVEDASVVMIKTKKGQVIASETSWILNNENEFFYCNLHGKEGTGFLNPFRIFKSSGINQIEIPLSKKSQSYIFYIKSYENELKHFISSIKGYTKWVSTCEEATSRLDLIGLIYKSAKLNKEIILK